MWDEVSIDKQQQTGTFRYLTISQTLHENGMSCWIKVDTDHVIFTSLYFSVNVEVEY